MVPMTMSRQQSHQVATEDIEYEKVTRSGSDVKRGIMDARELPAVNIHEKFHSSKFDHYKVKNVLVYCKPYDSEVIKSFVKLYEYIMQSQNKLQIYVESWVLKELVTLELELSKQPLIFENKTEEIR